MSLMSEPTLSISKEDAERLLDAISWIEGEGQAMRTTAEYAEDHAMHPHANSQRRSFLARVNDKHDHLKRRLEDFTE